MPTKRFSTRSTRPTPCRPATRGAPRRPVAAARLHAHEAVLDEVPPPDPVPARDPVRLLEEGGRRQAPPVDRDRVAALELDLDVLRLGRGVLGVRGELE